MTKEKMNVVLRHAAEHVTNLNTINDAKLLKLNYESLINRLGDLYRLHKVYLLKEPKNKINDENTMLFQNIQNNLSQILNKKIVLDGNDWKDF